MKTTFYKLIPALLFLISFSGCKGNAPENPTDLTGTSWKLAGIYDVQSETLTVLEPIDCNICYFLTFANDTMAIGRSTGNDVGVNLASKEHIIFTMTEAGEFGDGDIFCDAIYKVKSYSVSKTELKFFFNEKNNYLLYKPKNQ